MLLNQMGGNKQTLNGIVVGGLGEGAYFISMQHYKNEIKKKLGFDAYPGTLNIKTGKNQIDSFKKFVSIRIDGYKSGDKFFWGACCHKAKIKNINGSIIIPDLTKHENIMEFIAPVHLKSALKLKNGDKIKIEIIGTKTGLSK